MVLLQPGSVWCLRFLIPSKTTWMPVIWSHVSIRQSCHCWGHAHLSGLYCHLGQWWLPDQATTAENHVWVLGPTAARICVIPKVTQKPWSSCHIANRAILTRVACASNQSQDAIWVQTVAEGHVALLHLRSVLMSVLLQGAMGTMCDGTRRPCPSLTLGDGWPCPSLAVAARELSWTLMGKLPHASPHTWERWFHSSPWAGEIWSWWHRYRRDGSALAWEQRCFGGLTDQLSYHVGSQLGLGLAQTNIYPI